MEPTDAVPTGEAGNVAPETLFPEDRFPCPEPLAEAYWQRCRIGRERMARSRAVVCGLARSLGAVAGKTIARIRTLGGMFLDFRVVIYENDSDDDTAAVLKAWSRSDDRVHVISQTLGTRRHPQKRCLERAVEMAEYRNRCRAAALALGERFDYVIVVDTDLETGWSFDGFADTFGHDHWDVVGSNGLLFKPMLGDGGGFRRVHFDAWAFRHVGHPEPHGSREINVLQFERGAPFVPVLSCFGGAAVYRMDAMRAAAYSGGDCEHVPLHKNMSAKGFGRIYLNPSQITVYGTVPC